jgi:hypothetical protein
VVGGLVSIRWTRGKNWEGRDTRTGFSFAVERGESCERGEQDAEIGERHEEREPVHSEGDKAKMGVIRAGLAPYAPKIAAMNADATMEFMSRVMVVLSSRVRFLQVHG